jgi:hypothetical protein
VLISRWFALLYCAIPLYIMSLAWSMLISPMLASRQQQQQQQQQQQPAAPPSDEDAMTKLRRRRQEARQPTRK